MKTALVYDWFSETGGGGEKAFEAVYNLFPSPIYTLLKDTASLNKTSFARENIHASFIQKFPRALKYYRYYFPFYPLAIEKFDLSNYDLIISCSHCVAKGVLTHAEQLHLCYCYTPVRYAWDLTHQYLGSQKKWNNLAHFFLHYLRQWDVQSARRVDGFAAISHYIARRIQKIYGRKAAVIYPPVDTNFFTIKTKKKDFYVAASRLVPYKKMDLIAEAFSQMPDKKLVIIGDGPDLQKVKSKSAKNIEILGYQSDNVLKKYLQNAKAFIFAAIEDFGILPVEAQSCGTPVIAFGKGASLETVKNNETGIFFQEQSPFAIQEAVRRFEQLEFDPTQIRAHAETFNLDRFSREFKAWVQSERAKNRTKME
ncbi:MAG TPA: glycosyltransferase [Chlamydiales bacterium]|nr:glycosyltransferase [Chlamydiales bacterium]